MDDLWVGLGAIAFGAIFVALIPRVYRNPLTTSVEMQQVTAEQSLLGQRFGRSAFRARMVVMPWFGPLVLLTGVGILLRGQDGYLRALEQAAWSIAAIVFVLASIVGFSIFLFGRPDILLPARLRGQPGFLADNRKVTRPAGHEVTVMDVRPGPQDTYAPYFVATCQCGWLSNINDTAPPAFEEGRKHDPNVKAEVSRPIA